MKFYEITFWAGATIAVFFLATHGFRYTLPDETYTLFAGHRLLNGQLPYRDFPFVYTPGAIFLTTLAYKLFGESVLGARILFAFLATLSSMAFYYLARLITKNRLLVFAAVAIFLLFGPGQINFLLPRQLATFSLIFVCLLLLLFLNRKRHAFLILAGIFSFTTFLLKQNFLIAALIAVFVFLAFSPNANRGKLVLFYCVGFIFSLLVFLLYLLLTGSLFPFLENMTFYSFEKILVEGLGDTPFITVSGGIKALPRIAVYLLPAAISISGMIYSYFYSRRLFFLPAFFLALYVVGLRPVSDWVHLAPILSLASLPLLVISTTRNHTVRVTIGILLAGLALSGLVVGLRFGYYRWGDPLLENNYFISDKKIMLFGDHKSYKEVPVLTKFINDFISPEEETFVNSFAPWLYYFSVRENATRFDYITPDSLNLKMRAEIIDRLLRRKIKLVFTAENPSWGDQQVQRFIEANYDQIGKVSDLVAWKIKQKNQ